MDGPLVWQNEKFAEKTPAWRKTDSYQPEDKMEINDNESASLEVSRYEIKFILNLLEVSRLSQALKNVMLEDSHNGTNGYLIRSLYFDTYGETDFYQKIAGIENRKKIRLRIYNPIAEQVKLEIKRKFANEQIKKSAIISRYDAKKLIACEYGALLKYKNKTARMIYHVMHINHVRPAVLVEYRRKAFIHPTNNIRITLDTDIRSSETYFNLFTLNPVLTPVEEFAFALAEVKYDAFLMRWLSDLLSDYGFNRSAYSKYAMSRGIFERFIL